MSKSATVAKVKVASLNPEDMVAGGLPSDFDGFIRTARFVPYDYPKTDGTRMDHHVLTLRLEIEPVPESGYDTFFSHISAGQLENHVPSMDGVTPCNIFDTEEGPEWEGVYALQVGPRDGLGKDTKVGHFFRALVDAGFDPALLADGNVTCLEGLFGHWDNVEYKSKGGNTGVTADGQKKVNNLLVLTEIKTPPKGSKAKTAASTSSTVASSASKKTTSKTPATTTKAVTPAEEPTEEEGSENDSVESAVSEFVLELLVAQEGKPLAVAKIAPKLMMGSLKAKGLSTAAIALTRDGSFYQNSDFWSYDPETKSIFLEE